MRTSIFNDRTGALLSDRVTLAKPIQSTIEVQNRLLDGSWHIQTIGSPAHSYELEFIIPATLQPTVDTLATEKATLRLERHGRTHKGIVSGDPDFEQLIGSTDPARALYKCHILLLLTGGD